jgi:hypothetical protein
MPERYFFARLANPEHTVPMPGYGMMFPTTPEGAKVDSWDPYYHYLLMEGSIIRVEPMIESKSKAAKE